MQYCDPRQRMIKFKCGHIEQVWIWQNYDIEVHFKDMETMLCSVCRKVLSKPI